MVNDVDLMLRAVRDGVGITYLLDAQIASELASGRLIALLQDWSPRRSGFYLYYPGKRHVPTALRVFIDFLKANLRQAAGATTTRKRASAEP